MASADWEKMTMQKVGAMKVHFQQKDREEKNHSNKDIDKSLSRRNYTIGCQDYEEAFAKLKKRVAEVDALIPPKRIRKDRVTCVMIEIPCPDAIRKAGKSDFFFYRTNKEMKEFFGEENVLGGFVHKDEVHEYAEKGGGTRLSLEHIHFMVAPYTKEKGINGKAFETRERLHNLNDRLDEMCVQHFGVNLNTHSTPRKKTVEDLKRESYGQELINEMELLEKRAQESKNRTYDIEQQWQEAMMKHHEEEIKHYDKIDQQKQEIKQQKQQLEDVKVETDALLKEQVEIEFQTEEAKKRLEEYNFTLEELEIAKRATKKGEIPVVEPVKTIIGKDTNHLKIDKKDWMNVVGVLKKASVLMKEIKEKTKEIVDVKKQLENVEAKLERYDKFLKKENLVEHFQEFVRGKERTEISSRILSKQKQIEQKRIVQQNESGLELERKRKKQELSR